MLSKETFQARFSTGVHLLDGATGTCLAAAGMPRRCCMAEWILAHPDVLLALQKAYAEAGSEIIYAPTFRAQPMALAPFGLDSRTEIINEMLVSLSRKAAPGCLIAGNLTTLKGTLRTSDDACFERMVMDYRRQIRALVNGGADLLAAETLLHPLEAQAILTAAEMEHASSVMLSFALRPDGTLYSGHAASDVFSLPELSGAVALGVNCLAADASLAPLLRALRPLLVDRPLLVKPNAGKPSSDSYPINETRFVQVLKDCVSLGANLVGGCCGTTPAYIAALSDGLSRKTLPAF